MKSGCGQEQFLRYNTDLQAYYKNTFVPVVKHCNGFVVKNIGTTICSVNGDPLQPGESKSVGGNRAEIYEGRIDLAFTLQTPPPLTIVNAATVTQKFYMEGTGYDPLT